MGLRRRRHIGPVAIVAAAVLGGLMPHALVRGIESSPARVLEAGQTLASEPIHCVDATCGKGSPTPTSPSPSGAMVVMLAGAVAVGAALSAFRHRRERLVALPAGSPDPLDHPPQFS